MGKSCCDAGARIHFIDGSVPEAHLPYVGTGFNYYPSNSFGLKENWKNSKAGLVHVNIKTLYVNRSRAPAIINENKSQTWYDKQHILEYYQNKVSNKLGKRSL